MVKRKTNPYADKWAHNPYNVPLDKYNRSGIYCIKVEGVILYVGQSKNMVNRINSHIYNISINKNEFKYRVLYICKTFHKTITFDVLEYCGIKDLDEKEKYWIGKYRPLLNTLLKKEKYEF